MKIFPNNINNQRAALTVIEVLVVIAIIVVLVVIIIGLPSQRYKARTNQITCIMKLKQIWVGHLMFANDHDGKFPNEIPEKEGGSMESLAAGDVAKQFQAIGDLLSGPKVLVCPTDTRWPATNFLELKNTNLSYFACADSRTSNASLFLVGDWNLTVNGTPVFAGRVKVNTNALLGWTAALHKTLGNIGLVDGSVSQASSKQLNAFVQGFRTNTTLIIP